VPDAIDARPYLVPVAQFLSEEGAELDTPFAAGLVADLNAALVQQFLDISVAKQEAMVQPNRVLNDRHRETVAYGFGSVTDGQPTPTQLRQHNPRQFSKDQTIKLLQDAKKGEKPVEELCRDLGFNTASSLEEEIRRHHTRTLGPGQSRSARR